MTWLILFGAAVGVLSSHAELIHTEEYGYYLDIPDDLIFEDIHNAGEKITLKDEKSLFQVRIYSGSWEQITLQQSRELGIAGAQQRRFAYNGRRSVLAELVLNAEDGAYKGYILWIDAGGKVFRLLGITPVASFDAEVLKILSFLDSFATNAEERFLPGPISQADHPLQEPDQNLQLGDLVLENVVRSSWANAEQAVIDREAKVLARFPSREPDRVARAWSRFYRMVFRETRTRTHWLARKLAGIYESRGLDRSTWPRHLLALLQGFSYQRRGDASDIDASATVLGSASGDCDSLALVYLAVLDHWQFRGILMVSQVYAHAMAALDLSGNGARFPFEGKRWLVAELTARVDLGMIDSEMNDPSKWLGIDLKKDP